MNLYLNIQPPANPHPDFGDIRFHESCRQETFVCSLLYKPSPFLVGSLGQGGDPELAGSLLLRTSLARAPSFLWTNY